ncbi:cytochrome P450 [Verticillium dahliae]
MFQSLLALIDYTKDEATKTKLNSLAGGAYTEQIVSKRISVLDILESHPITIDVSVGIFLTLLPPDACPTILHLFSPLSDPARATLTFSILGGQPSLSGTGHPYMGVASNTSAPWAPLMLSTSPFGPFLAPTSAFPSTPLVRLLSA